MIHRFKFALRGILIGFIEEVNLKLHYISTVLALGLGIYLGCSSVEISILGLTATLVLSMEYVNTSIERLSNRVSLERHPLIRDTKDLAAGAVLIASIGAAVVGALILGPKLWILLLNA